MLKVSKERITCNIDQCCYFVFCIRIFGHSVIIYLPITLSLIITG